jgi:hypothetical protein
MIWVGLLLLAGAIYNFVFGGLLDSIVCFSLFVSLVSYSLLERGAEELSKSDRLRIFLVSATPGLILFGAQYVMVVEVEIGADRYESLVQWQQQWPTLRDNIDLAYLDSKISLLEFSELEIQVNHRRVEAAKKLIAGE